ncbi:seed dormancy control protein isoform X2 [Tasmannia lanceolata]|uniref:seed dormancy control protein isoform X2 n=1 Tax=Tasmannia lanceolata TaxID=3420 RepID=UPI004064299B
MRKCRMPLMLPMKTTEPNEEEEQRRADEGIEELLNKDRNHIHNTCMPLLKYDCTRRAQKISEVYGQWREEQRWRAARLERYLNGRWVLDEMIEEELARYNAHYNRAMVPSRLRDVAQILMPKWKLAMEKAALSWLGDWRPSAILGLVQTFFQLGFVSMSPKSEQALRVSRIEEMMLDEATAEYQATCVLHLPFGRVTESGSCSSGLKKKNKKENDRALESVKRELMKIGRLITQAQHLRYRAVELVVKRLLSQTQAAEFLVAFSGIQETVHQFASAKKAQTGPVCLMIEASTA